MNTTAEQIRKLVDSHPERYGPVLEKARQDCDVWCRTFRDQPDWVSGWGHDFACPVCTAHLKADSAMAYNPPNRFVCPNCGHVATGPKLDEAWVYYYRLEASAKLESVAVCALLGDPDAKAFMERFLDFYAQHYAGFAIHGEGNGKITPQILDEAVWCVQVLRALYPCRHLFDDAKRKMWYEKLFLPLAALVNAPEKQTSVHNHVMWHKCAVGTIALCFDEADLLKEVLDGTLGIRELAARGLTQDGFWFEGSPLYHYYAMEALTGFCQLYAQEHPHDPLIGLLERAHLAPLALSWDGWHLPSINDGWFPLSLDRFADQFHRAAAASQSQALWQQVEQIRKRVPQSIDRPAALLLDQVDDGIVLWKHTNLAIVREPVYAILKSGVIARSHMHKDYLSVVLPPFSKDLGTPGYGHTLYRSWYQVTASHNAIAVDYDQPRPVIPTHVEETENGVRTVVDSGWEHVVSASRTLTPEGDTLVDRTEIVLDGEHVIDWIFHSEGKPEFATEPGEEAVIGDRCGYQYFSESRIIECDDLNVSFVLDERKLTLQADVRGMEVFAAKSPGNPSNEMRTSIILRTLSDRALFEVRYKQENAEAAPGIFK